MCPKLIILITLITSGSTFASENMTQVIVNNFSNQNFSSARFKTATKDSWVALGFIKAGINEFYVSGVNPASSGLLELEMNNNQRLVSFYQNQTAFADKIYFNLGTDPQSPTLLSILPFAPKGETYFFVPLSAQAKDTYTALCGAGVIGGGGAGCKIYDFYFNATGGGGMFAAATGVFESYVSKEELLNNYHKTASVGFLTVAILFGMGMSFTGGDGKPLGWFVGLSLGAGGITGEGCFNHTEGKCD